MYFRNELCVLLLLLGVSGCALFRPDAVEQLQQQLAQKPDLPQSDSFPAVPVKRVVRMSSTVLVRPVGESRVSKQLWQQLSEVGLMARPHQRRQLNQAGFRVGVTERPYPYTLERVLQAAGDRSGAESGGGRHMFFSARSTADSPIVNIEGGDTLIDVRHAVGAEIPDDIDVPGLDQISPAESVRCVLRMTTLEGGDNWARIRFQPELHYGQETTRYTVRDGQEQLPVRQEIIPLFEQRFELRLNPDDAVVLGYHDQADWSPGQFFFQSGSLSAPQEHLVVLKLTQVETVHGQSAMDVRYSRH